MFLFLALARPKIQGRIFPIKKQGHVAVIIDDSYSMGYGQRFENAKIEAQRILNQLSTGSELEIIVTSQSGPVYQGRNLKLAVKAVDSIIVSDLDADLSASLNRVQIDLEKFGSANKEIFVITDLQRRAFIPILQNFKLKFPANVIDLGGAIENCTVTEVFLSERFPQVSRPAKISAKIKNNGSKGISQKAILRIRDKIEEKRIKIMGGEEKTVLFETEIGASGEYQGLVTIESDSLKIDDERYFVFSIPERIPVLLVYGQETDIFYLERALAPESTNTFVITKAGEKEFRQKNLNRFEVIGLINPTNFTRSDWQRLDYFRQKGGKVFIALGREPKDKFGLERFCDYELWLHPAGFVSIEQVQFTHPVLEIFASVDLSGTKFFQWSKVRPKKAKVLASFSDGNPFLLESEDKNYIITSTTFNLDATDIVFKPIFVPLIQRIFFYLAKGEFKTNYEVGSTISIEVNAAGLVKVKSPQEEYSVMPEIIDDRKIVKLKEVTKPGIYQIWDRALTVNINPAESDLTRVKETDLIKAGFKLAKESSAKATDLAGLFLYLALLAIALEMLIILV